MSREYQDLSGVSLRLIETIDDCLELKRWLGERRDVLGLDTETGGLDWWRQPLRLVQIGDADTGWAIPTDWLGVVKEILPDYDGPIALHNMKFDLHFLEKAGVGVPRHLLHDTMLMAHLVDPTTSNSLKACSARLIHPKTRAGDVMLKRAFRDEGWFWDTVPVDFAPYWQYGALDPVLTARLYREFRPRIDADFARIYETEVACAMTLKDMEARGVRLDHEYIDTTSAKLEVYLDQMRNWIHAEFGVENPNSNHQVIERMEADGVEFTVMTEKGNISLDKDVLKSLDHPLAQPLLEYRDKGKLLETYLHNYQELADGDLIHASVHPVGARTGRMSVSRPSLQNIPRDEHPRNAFIAREGRRLVLADYDQIEMRLLAHFAQEERMIEAIRYGDEMTERGYPGYDVHSMNTRAIYGIDRDDPVPKPKRQVTKNAGFAKIYGAGAKTFASTAGITVAEAEGFLEQYDRRYPGVTRFQGEVAKVAVRRALDGDDPYVIAPSGRRHPTTKQKIYKLVNYLIQGTAADVLKEAIVRLDSSGLADYALLPVHDELICDVPENEVEDYERELINAMEDRTSFAVPLTVDSEVVTSWGDKYRKEG